MRYLAFICFILIFLTGCQRKQENVNQVFNKEKLSDFTTQPPPKSLPPPPPMLPGKATIQGGPFDEFQTQTVEKEVAASDKLK